MKHHYIPQLYLKNFTLLGNERDRLWVFDQEQITQWPSTPEGAAHEKDFYRIDDKQDPMAVEAWFSRFESVAAPVLRHIIESRSLPPVESTAFGYFITFIALSVGRVPRIRDQVSAFLERVKQQQDFASKTTGLPQQPFPNFDRTWHVERIMDNAEALRPLLWMRRWSVWVVADDAPELICSDNPVALHWTIPVPGPWPPGFGLRNTQVTMPLSRRVMVVGSFEGQANERYLNANDVATANSCSGGNSDRLFSAEADFAWMMPNGQIGRKADLIAELQGAKSGN